MIYMFVIVFVLNILEFEGVLGRKSLHSPYSSTHKSIYLKFRGLLDYNYEDWESTTPFYLADFDQTNCTSNSEVTIFTESVVQTGPNVTIAGDATSIINTTTKDNFTANITVNEDILTITKDVSNTTIKEVAIENITNDQSDMTSQSNAFNMSAPNITSFTGLNESELFEESVSPPTIEKYSPWTVSDSGTPHGLDISTPNPIFEEIKELHHKEGYFTASLIVLLRILLTLEGTSIRTLLGTLKFEVERRDRNNLLPIFGGKPVEVFLAAIQMLAPEPLDVMKSHLSFVEYALENRKSIFNEDINKLLNNIDTVFKQTDAEDIATVLTELKSFPNSTPKDIIDGVLKSFFSEPFGRLQGTEDEKLMIDQINDIIHNRFGGHIFNRRLGMVGYESTSNTFVEELNRRRNQIRITKQPVLSTSRVEFMEDWSYVTNATIMQDVKHRMKMFKKKFKHIKKNEKKIRGPTTTTTTATTTKRLKMRKSKYYIRRYVKRNLYKMKTTTKKTTRFRYKYYGKIRKFNIEYSRRKDPRSESEGYYSDENIEGTESAISLEESGDKDEETTSMFKLNSNNGGVTNKRNVRLDIDDSDEEVIDTK